MKRTKLIVSRILQIIPILLVVTILAFVLSNASAGDVATVTLQSRGMQITEESLAAIREELGLNALIYLQYWNWLKNAVRFDFGNSFRQDAQFRKKFSPAFRLHWNWRWLLR
ncbi:MAG: hypothetical protein V8T47_06685 [Oscillospiraceae bacterium]